MHLRSMLSSAAAVADVSRRARAKQAHRRLTLANRGAFRLVLLLQRVHVRVA